jgi:large subunit ribosomal protein L3
MPAGILGKKIAMTQLYRSNGDIVPVTVMQAGPCSVLQIRTAEKDGYNAVQIGFDARKESGVNKPDAGMFRKAGVTPKRFVREIRIDPKEKYEPAQDIRVDVFKPGDVVDITGTTKGKGFQGGMKRWGWAGGPKTHGSTSHRRVGSIGSSSDPSRVFKGHHMPGHMGHQTRTVQNVEVVQVDKENNLLSVKGPVPGPQGCYLIIRLGKKRQVVRKKIVPPKAKTKMGVVVKKPTPPKKT